MTERLNIPKVTVYAGPMAAGKTNHLHSLIGGFQATHHPYEAFKPSHDIRDSVIQPRGLSEIDAQECVVVRSLAEIDAERLTRIGRFTIVLDEFHMFSYDENRDPIPDVYFNTMLEWGRFGITNVYAAGLDIAASGNTFPIFNEAHRLGAEIVMLTASCASPVNGEKGPTCREVARNSQIWSKKRKIPYRPPSLPDLLPQGGDPDMSYIPVCAKHNLEAYSKEISIDYIYQTDFTAQVA
jgi:thymidine kinase